MRWLGILAIWGYRWFLRPFMRRRCLYDESCSTFALRTLRERGVMRALPMIRARVRSCSMPSACFVIDAHGRPQLLSAHGQAGEQPPIRAVELIALDAAQVGHALMRRGAD